MPLTYIEQIQLKQSNSLPNIPNLPHFILAGALEYAATFISTHKVFATEDAQAEPINQKASSYLSKMFGLSSQVVRHQLEGRNAMSNALIGLTAAYLGVVPTVTIGGNPIVFTYSTIQNGTAVQWEEFLGGIMPRLFEILAGVRKDEKAEYDSR